VLATANTGLAATDVFFWGNRVGDVTSPASGGSFVTNVSSDGGAIVGVAPAGSVGITNRFDVNKTNSINVSGDRGEVVGNAPGSLLRINIGTGGPFAPEGGDGGGGGPATPATSGGDAGIASALAGSGSTAGPTAGGFKTRGGEGDSPILLQNHLSLMPDGKIGTVPGGVATASGDWPSLPASVGARLDTGSSSSGVVTAAYYEQLADSGDTDSDDDDDHSGLDDELVEGWLSSRG
jgi:hypothetical protein